MTQTFANTIPARKLACSERPHLGGDGTDALGCGRSGPTHRTSSLHAPCSPIRRARLTVNELQTQATRALRRGSFKARYTPVSPLGAARDSRRPPCSELELRIRPTWLDESRIYEIRRQRHRRVEGARRRRPRHLRSTRDRGVVSFRVPDSPASRLGVDLLPAPENDSGCSMLRVEAYHAAYRGSGRHAHPHLLRFCISA